MLFYEGFFSTIKWLLQSRYIPSEVVIHKQEFVYDVHHAIRGSCVSVNHGGNGFSKHQSHTYQSEKKLLS